MTTTRMSHQVYKKKILDHVSSLKVLIKQHNERSGTLIKPIHLSFRDEEGNDKGKNTDKGTENTRDEDLHKPFKDVLRSPFTRRIIEFSFLKHLMPKNLRIYDGSTELDNHVSRFVRAADQEKWQMPIWYRMFKQMLDGPTRGWFDRLHR
ncbi:hypothetical protein Tco_1431548 [Tanacetum coccineum]